MPRGDARKRERLDDSAAASVPISSQGAASNSQEGSGAAGRRKLLRKTEEVPVSNPIGEDNAVAALPSSSRRHEINDEDDRIARDQDEDEEWEDEETESDTPSLPEEIVDEGEYDEEDDGDDDAGAADEGDDDDEGAATGEVSKTANSSSSSGAKKKDRAVRFVDGPEGPAGSLNHNDELTAKVYRPDKKRAQNNAGEEVKLTYANRAYDSFFQLRTEYPCLSFTVLRDFDGDVRTKYPMSMYLACGTQAPKKSDNQIVILQLSNLCKTKYDEASDSDEEEIGMVGADSSDDDDDDDDNDDVGEREDGDGAAGMSKEDRKDLRAAARERMELNDGEGIVNARTISFPGTVNRLRAKEDAPNILAAWCAEDATIRIVDAMDDARALADFDNWTRERAANYKQAPKNPHIFSSKPRSAEHHRAEGYGLGWARAGDLTRFASGDNNGHIVVWQGTGNQGGTGWAAQAAWHREAPSVEEIVWSAVEPTVFIAARAGGAVEVWDTRDMRSCRVQFRADPTDINVADWNRAVTNSHLLITGADSGIIGVWDLRRVQQSNPAPLQRLAFHQGSSITSLEFSVHNETVLAATSSDGQCSLWDLCVERDIDEEREMVGNLFGRPDVSELPDALMFQHQGLTFPKECHFHPQIPGAVVTTDFHGINVFKPCNWKSLMK